MVVLLGNLRLSEANEYKRLLIMTNDKNLVVRTWSPRRQVPEQ